MIMGKIKQQKAKSEKRANKSETKMESKCSKKGFSFINVLL